MNPGEWAVDIASTSDEGSVSIVKDRFMRKPTDSNELPWSIGDACWYKDRDAKVFGFGASGKIAISIGSADSSDLVIWVDADDIGRMADVLDADGVPVKVGESLFHVSDGSKVSVHRLVRSLSKGNGCIMDEFGGVASASLYVHEPPVFDAYGKRIKVGDTVYIIAGRSHGAKVVVTRFGATYDRENPDDPFDLIVYDSDQTATGESFEKANNVTHNTMFESAEGKHISVGDVGWDDEGHKVTVMRKHLKDLLVQDEEGIEYRIEPSSFSIEMPESHSKLYSDICDHIESHALRVDDPLVKFARRYEDILHEEGVL